MKLFSENISQVHDDSSQAISQDFDSEDICSVNTSENSDPLALEIIGLEILLDQSHLSDADENLSMVSLEVDSLVLARKRLSKIHHETEETERRPRRRLGEVDSLVLARRRVPNIVRERVPNVVRLREARNARIHRRLCTRRAKRHLNSNVNNDDTASGESSFDFDCGEVDSLILAGKRLGTRRPRSRISENRVEEKTAEEANDTRINRRKGLKEHTVETKSFHDLLTTTSHNSAGFNCAA